MCIQNSQGTPQRGNQAENSAWFGTNLTFVDGKVFVSLRASGSTGPSHSSLALLLCCIYQAWDLAKCSADLGFWCCTDVTLVLHDNSLWVQQPGCVGAVSGPAADFDALLGFDSLLQCLI